PRSQRGLRNGNTLVDGLSRTVDLQNGVVEVNRRIPTRYRAILCHEDKEGLRPWLYVESDCEVEYVSGRRRRAALPARDWDRDHNGDSFHRLAHWRFLAFEIQPVVLKCCCQCNWKVLPKTGIICRQMVTELSTDCHFCRPNETEAGNRSFRPSPLLRSSSIRCSSFDQKGGPT